MRSSHAPRASDELRLPLAEVRRVEQHQATMVNWLLGTDHSPIETTIGYERRFVAASLGQQGVRSPERIGIFTSRAAVAVPCAFSRTLILRADTAQLELRYEVTYWLVRSRLHLECASVRPGETRRWTLTVGLETRWH